MLINMSPLEKMIIQALENEDDDIILAEVLDFYEYLKEKKKRQKDTLWKNIQEDEPTNEEIQRLQAIQAHFGQERQKRLEYREEALGRKEETEKMVIGAEIVQGTLERQVEVHVGDDMRELMNVEVLVEDDKIIAIRG